MDDNTQNYSAIPDYPEETDIYAEGVDTDYSHKDIKRVVGEAIAGVDGVLGLKGRLADIFKRDEDLTRGISVHKVDDDNVDVSARVIAEAGYSSADLLQRLADSITLVLEDELGLVANTVDVQISDTMTRAEFYEKYDPQRAIH